MPVKPNDSDKTKMPKTGPNVFGGAEETNTGPSNLKPRTQSVDYGMGQDAQLKPGREETEDQEYSADGLPRTDKYSFDNTARGKSGQSDRKNPSSCGC